MANDFRWDDGIEITGLGQFHNVIFCSDDRNIDLYDNFVPLNRGIDDQYWISVRFPKDSVGFWETKELDWLEEQIAEDFEYEGQLARLILEFGEGFPRCFPALWYFTLSDKEEQVD
jgi:hypothetical protein